MSAVSGTATKRWIRSLWGLVLLPLPVFSADPEGQASSASTGGSASTVPAILMTQEINFHFQSFTTFYSCHALEGRIEQVLRAVGADPDLKVRASGCPSGEIARLPSVRITITSPVEVTPETLAELEKTRSTRELAARVRGEKAPKLDEQIPAHWKEVSFNRGRLRIEPGDCELMEQMVRYVFPKLAIRVTKQDLACSPNQVAFSQPRLVVQALVAMPTASADAPANQKQDSK